MSIINAAIEAVMDLIDALGLYANISREHLGSMKGFVARSGLHPLIPSFLIRTNISRLILRLTGNMVTCKPYPKQ